jgi:GGDEF domain-containing protein
MSRNLLDALRNTAKALKGRAANDEPRLSAAERAQLTLDSIGDAVITTDIAGNITYLNPVAESMTGKKIVAALDQPHRIADTDLRITVSVGISVYADDGTDAETLLKNADMALIHAKTRGLGKYQFFGKI